MMFQQPASLLAPATPGLGNIRLGNCGQSSSFRHASTLSLCASQPKVSMYESTTFGARVGELLAPSMLPKRADRAHHWTMRPCRGRRPSTRCVLLQPDRPASPIRATSAFPARVAPSPGRADARPTSAKPHLSAQRAESMGRKAHNLGATSAFPSPPTEGRRWATATFGLPAQFLSRSDAPKQTQGGDGLVGKGVFHRKCEKSNILLEYQILISSRPGDPIPRPPQRSESLVADGLDGLAPRERLFLGGPSWPCPLHAAPLPLPCLRCPAKPSPVRHRTPPRTGFFTSFAGIDKHPVFTTIETAFHIKAVTY